MKKRICAYCGNEFGKNHQRTAEHIFPQGLLELYPYQDVSFTPEKIFKDNSGLIIADVCNRCNNEVLSELDSYGCNLIKTQFYKEIEYKFKDETIEKEIDYDLISKWVIKIAYNYLRSRKNECTFIQRYIPCILKRSGALEGFSIFLGLHMNTTPLPERCYEYQPLCIIENPKLIGTSLGISMRFNLPFDLNSIIIQGAYEKLLIRLGNLIIYLIFWQEGSDRLQETYDQVLIKNFNLIKIVKGKCKYNLKRVTASTNMTINYGHILSKSALHQDDMLLESTLHGKSVIETRNLFESMRSEEDWKKSGLMVEREMFPNNRKVRDEFEEVFGKEV
ncbi:hypothetical protein [Anaerotignum propionicum]|uniref:hypothetical protein n=1 Tax=Anaerotignum propionicum TaxID=28446 RepID=UPI00289DD8E6|nr:hypothetical protein [Anaerotignum propionicum]